MSYIDEMIKSFEIPREGQKGAASGKENSREKNGSAADMHSASYGNTEQETKQGAASGTGKEEEDSKELKAIRDMRRVLYFLEKKVRGTLSEADRQEIKENRE